MLVKFDVLGEPMGKQRPRVRKIGNFAQTYTPKETITYESKVVYAYKNATDHYFGQSEIEAQITAYYQLSKAHYGKKGINKKGVEKLTGLVNPTKKPDCDNIAKIILDALNGIAYYDDSQVTKLVVYKRYAEQPKVEVVIKERNTLV